MPGLLDESLVFRLVAFGHDKPGREATDRLVRVRGKADRLEAAVLAFADQIQRSVDLEARRDGADLLVGLRVLRECRD